MNMLLNYEINMLKRKVDTLDEDFLIKEGQITILKDWIGKHFDLLASLDSLLEWGMLNGQTTIHILFIDYSVHTSRILTGFTLVLSPLWYLLNRKFASFFCNLFESPIVNISFIFWWSRQWTSFASFGFVSIGCFLSYEVFSEDLCNYFLLVYEVEVWFAYILSEYTSGMLLLLYGDCVYNNNHIFDVGSSTLSFLAGKSSLCLLS